MTTDDTVPAPAPLSCAPAAPPPAADRAADLGPQLAQVGERLAHLEALLTARRGDADGREAVIQQLHDQLQEARADLVWKILRPILVDLVRLHDDLARAQERDPGGPLGEFRQDLLDALERQGFTPFTVEGDRFDPRRQQAVRVVPAPAADQVGQVLARHAPGFASADRLLRPEKVAVYGAAPARPEPSP
jgi:molecular chaperone GrpE